MPRPSRRRPPAPPPGRRALADAVRETYPHGVEAVVAVVDAAFAALEARLTPRMVALEAEVAALRRRLAADSTTSSKPPSTDVSRAVRPVSLRERTGWRAGGQRGHPGGTLAWRPAPDAVVCHRPAACAGCGRALAADAAARVVERAQVVDLPPVALVATEHRRLAVTCAQCGHASAGALPPGVLVGAQYGPEVRALAVALHSYHLLPYGRTAELLDALLDALLGDGPSPGTLARWSAAAAAALAPAQRAAARAVAASPTAHADETTLHVAGRRVWLHVACTATHTHYHALPRASAARPRGHRARRRVGRLHRRARARRLVGELSPGRGRHPPPALPRPPAARGEGPVRADAGAEAPGGLARRRRRAARPPARAGAPRRRGRPPGARARHPPAARGAVRRAAAAGRPALAPATRRRLAARYAALLRTARRLHPYPVQGRDNTRAGRPQRGKVAAFADRLLKYRAEVLRCAGDATIPPDNNQAERDLRMAKLADKVSGGFRSLAGAHAFATLRSALSTGRKQGRTAAEVLRAAFDPLGYAAAAGG